MPPIRTLAVQFRTFCSDEDEVEARSMIAFSLAVGKHFLAADHGDRTRTEVVELASAHLFS
ncbi:hypothetical protein [Sciscionella marina]|uniref:hypothetical protein n=1 Tax=Sciscionella marina TaxID=508770 RepID=UPI000364D405|nr:hypothetical protein [Sciscionella marina]